MKQARGRIETLERENAVLLQDHESLNKSIDELKESLEAALNRVTRTMSHWNTEKERCERYEKALKDAREQFALMSDGEGSDTSVYVKMSYSAMKRIDQALSKPASPDET